jgi:putative thioredoxin
MAINITENNFKEKVVDASFEKPVLVDFWAEWCNPCKVLSPVLDKLEKEFAGGFILAKVNTEESQQLAMMFKINSIPDVKLINQGKIQDQFTGAKQEKEVRAFLEKYIEKPVIHDPYEKLAIDKPLDLLKKLKSDKEVPEKKDEYLWIAFKCLVKKGGKKDDCTSILKEIPDEDSTYSKERILFEKFLEEKDSIKNLQDLIGSKKIIILDKYLSIVENASYNSRKDFKDPLLACFYFLNADDEDLFNYRRKLSSLLF